MELDDLTVAVATIEDLIAMKRAAGRPQDLVDLRIARPRTPTPRLSALRLLLCRTPDLLVDWASTPLVDRAATPPASVLQSSRTPAWAPGP